MRDLTIEELECVAGAGDPARDAATAAGGAIGGAIGSRLGTPGTVVGSAIGTAVGGFIHDHAGAFTSYTGWHGNYQGG